MKFRFKKIALYTFFLIKFVDAPLDMGLITAIETSDGFDFIEDAVQEGIGGGTWSDSEQLERIEHCQLSSSCTPFDILSALLSLGVGPLLQEDLYLHTYPLVVRNLLDNPLFLPIRTYERPHVLGIDIFYNQMSRARFYKNSSSICSYLALNEDTLLKKLGKIFNVTQENFMLDIPTNLNPLDFLPLFKDFTVQERRAGGMLHGLFFHKNFSLLYNVPLYYLQHNFYATQAERDALELVLGKAAEEDNLKFAKQHLICDKFGLGDTRFYFGIAPEFLHSFGMVVGPFITLPTSFLFLKGLNGSNISFASQRPTFNIGDIACQWIEGDNKGKQCAIEQVQAFGLGALDELAAILLQAPLGNYRHMGLGWCVRTSVSLNRFIRRRWAQKFSWQGFFSLEYITPGKEQRAFIEGCVAEEVEELGLNKTGTELQEYLQQLESDPVQAQKVLNFINARLINIFYPYSYNVKVWPGFVGRYSSRFICEGKYWGFMLGNDLWVKGPETVYAPCNNGQPMPSSLNMQKATKPFAYQTKTFGDIFYRIAREPQTWTLGLSCESNSLLSSSIGRSFTVSLIFDATF